jgi:hypothetical protein
MLLVVVGPAGPTTTNSAAILLGSDKTGSYLVSDNVSCVLVDIFAEEACLSRIFDVYGEGLPYCLP